MGKKKKHHGGGDSSSSKPDPEDQLRQAAKVQALKAGLQNPVNIRVVFLESCFKCVSVASPDSNLSAAISEAAQLGKRHAVDKWGLNMETLRHELSAGFMAEDGRVLTLAEWAAKHFVVIMNKQNEEDGGLTGKIRKLEGDLAADALKLETEYVLKKDHLNLQKDHDELKKDHEALKKDHEALKKDHEALKHDYVPIKDHEQLKKDYEQLKNDHEQLKNDHLELKTAYEDLSGRLEGLTDFTTAMHSVKRGVLLTSAREKAVQSLGVIREADEKWEDYFARTWTPGSGDDAIVAFLDLLKSGNSGRNKVAHEASALEQALAVTSVQGRNRDKWLALFTYVHGSEAADFLVGAD